MSTTTVSNNSPIVILVVCGSGVATSTVVAERIKEIAQNVNVPVDVHKAPVTAIHGEIGNLAPDLIVNVTPVPDDVRIRTISGINLVTGINEDETETTIGNALRDISDGKE